MNKKNDAQMTFRDFKGPVFLLRFTICVAVRAVARLQGSQHATGTAHHHQDLGAAPAELPARVCAQR